MKTKIFFASLLGATSLFSVAFAQTYGSGDPFVLVLATDATPTYSDIQITVNGPVYFYWSNPNPVTYSYGPDEYTVVPYTFDLYAQSQPGTYICELLAGNASDGTSPYSLTLDDPYPYGKLLYWTGGSNGGGRPNN